MDGVGVTRTVLEVADLLPRLDAAALAELYASSSGLLVAVAEAAEVWPRLDAAALAELYASSSGLLVEVAAAAVEVASSMVV